MEGQKSFISTCGGSKDILKPASKFTPDEFITVPELVLNYNANMGVWTTWIS